MANGHGGQRAGAGPKTTRKRFAKPVALAEKRIADRLPEVVDQMFALSQAGDYRATAYLIDRILGKPMQAVEAELSGKDGSPLKIVVEYTDPIDAADPAPGAEEGDR